MAQQVVASRHRPALRPPPAAAFAKLLAAALLPLRQCALSCAMISLPIVTARRRAPGVGVGSLNVSKRRASAGEPVAAPAAAPEPGDPQAGPSRSARKRQAEALQKLGVGLTRMRPAKLRELQQHLHLPEALLEALLEVHRLRSGPALARQRQYIGRLMREVEPEPIERALAEFSRSGDAKMPR